MVQVNTGIGVVFVGFSNGCGLSMTNKEKFLKVLRESTKPLPWAEILEISGMNGGQLSNALKASPGLFNKKNKRYSLNLNIHVRVASQTKDRWVETLLFFYSNTEVRCDAWKA